MVTGDMIFDSLDQLLPVLDVGAVVPHLRVEDVAEAVLPHEVVGEDPDALAHLMLEVLRPPHFPQAIDRVHFFLGSSNVHHEVGKRNSHFGRELPRLGGSLDEGQNRLPIVLGNIFGVISQTGVVTNFIFRSLRSVFGKVQLKIFSILFLRHDGLNFSNWRGIALF